MASSVTVPDLKAALVERSYPSVTTYNRLEGRPRTVSFDRALRAEVRDALWMLTRQWQLGEFKGDDAGSPVAAKLLLQTTRLTKYQPDAAATEDFPYDTCFETKVERRNIPLMRAGQPASLDLRLAMGRYWLKLIAPLPHDYRSNFIKAYSIATPDPTDPTQADICAHFEVWQTVEAVAGRAMDGAGLYLYLTADPAHHAYDNVQGIVATDQGALDDCATRFVAWFQRTLSTPASGDDAWEPAHLEYQFEASAPLPGGGEKVYSARQYYQGRLDWYTLDVDAAAAPLGNVPRAGNTGLPPDAPRTMIPSPVSFAGMPNTRWWAFEDRATNFGDIDAATTDLAKLLFIEFALVYSNDWFVIPYSLPLGSVAAIRGMAVTNVFGDREWITAAGSGADANWQQWDMFSINVTGEAGATRDTSLLVLPTAASIQRGEPIEDVSLIRDEAANMVWGIEKTIQLVTGDPKRGIEAAREATSFYERIVGVNPPAVKPAAPILYQLMSAVPENWIPFIPVHVANNNREIQLQRASMPRDIGNDPTALPLPLRKVKPRTTLLRQGLDQAPPAPYFVFEEEVPRAGARVFQHYQRTRACDDGTVCGRVLTWLRAAKQTGRGEGSSGLVFDQLVTPAKRIGHALIELRRFDEAVAFFKRALRQNSSDMLVLGGLASALAHLGRDAEAREVAARLLEIDPAFTITSWIARANLSNMKLQIEGLRKAGLPE
jgi:tetratricopeptide (TPR) repeat protein